MTFTQPNIPAPTSGFNQPPYPAVSNTYKNVEIASNRGRVQGTSWYVAPGYTGFKRSQWVEINPLTNTFVKSTDTSTGKIAFPIHDAGFEPDNVCSVINPSDDYVFLMPLKPGSVVDSTDGFTDLAGKEVSMYTDVNNGIQYIDTNPSATGTKKFMVAYSAKPIVLRRQYDQPVAYIKIMVLPEYRLIS